MMYHVNIKSLRQSVFNLSTFLTHQGYSIPLKILFEGFARALFFNNWKTLEVSVTHPKILDFYKSFCKYLIEIETTCDKKVLLDFLQEAAKESGHHIAIDNFVQSKTCYHMEVSLIQDECDILPCLAKLYRKLQGSYFEVFSFECCQLVHKKQNCMEKFATQHDLN